MSTGSHYTRWHKCLDGLLQIEKGRAPKNDLNEATRLLVRDCPWLFDDVPVFVIDPVNVTEQAAFFASENDHTEYQLLVQNSSVPWPFERFVVEARMTSELSGFMYVRREGSDQFLFTLVDGGTKNGREVGLVLVNSLEPTDGIGLLGGLQINQPWAKICERSGGDYVQEMGATAQAFRKLMVSLATKGVVQERIEAPKFLNKQRARKGRTPVPTVIHMRAGHYYDRHGNQHSYDERKPVAIHWRRGHVRNVWCGTGDERHREPRYIAPCLVNYDGGDAPQHKVRVLH